MAGSIAYGRSRTRFSVEEGVRDRGKSRDRFLAPSVRAVVQASGARSCHLRVSLKRVHREVTQGEARHARSVKMTCSISA